MGIMEVAVEGGGEEALKMAFKVEVAVEVASEMTFEAPVEVALSRAMAFFEIGFLLLFGKNSSLYDFGFSFFADFSMRRLVRCPAAALDAFLFGCSPLGFMLSRSC